MNIKHTPVSESSIYRTIANVTREFRTQEERRRRKSEVKKNLLNALEKSNNFVAPDFNSLIEDGGLKKIKVEVPNSYCQVKIGTCPDTTFYMVLGVADDELISSLKLLKTCSFKGVNRIVVRPSTRISDSVFENSFIDGLHADIYNSYISDSVISINGVLKVLGGSIIDSTVMGDGDLKSHQSNLKCVDVSGYNDFYKSTLNNLTSVDNMITNSVISEKSSGYNSILTGSNINLSNILLSTSKLKKVFINNTRIHLIDSDMDNSEISNIGPANLLNATDLARTKPLDIIGRALSVSFGSREGTVLFYKQQGHRKVLINQTIYTFNDGLKYVKEMENRMKAIQYEPLFKIGENFFNLLELID